MSVSIETIHQSPFLQLEDLLQGNDLNTSHLLGRYQSGNTISLIPLNYFRLSTQDITRIKNGENKIEAYTGHITIAPTSWLYITNGVRTWPSGSGYLIYADGFVEWSMARIKQDIIDIPPVTVAKQLRPRQYTQNKQVRLGFVVDESPAEIVISAKNEEGVEEKGIDIMAVCALQQAKIVALEKRIAALEVRIK